ncbi:ligand-binding sensor domain-containing protein [Flavobacterium glaciei]|uniref:Two component regulator with propeller domain n=1 Tax=Flavobacterium glaciei TaxID=386300 RepID=A0A562Q1H0_9FLAO|nr:two-component regulator propeller domain-containing protein [Flavobacterium glaciei]RDI57659.1 two component regulator with propeller domain [Flavobacterium glaciei]TWI50541.1 two component regulator with propeller domain [Flavobacterium glaciei]
MTTIDSKKVFIARNLILVLLTLQCSSCTGQVKEKSINGTTVNEVNTQPLILNQSTTFPQIHTNLNGMVREFVRTMYQDKKGNYWFGTNGNGMIRYEGKTLEKISIDGLRPFNVVREIVEDKAGYLWFATDYGLIKYDGEKFTIYSEKDGLQDDEIWGLSIDKSGLIWVGSTGGISHFDGKKFTPFLLPETKVENPKPMLSDKLVFQFLEDKNGTMWFATDGNGIFKYNSGEFTHLTTKNGLTDNNVADILEDRQGNIWIGTFYGGVSKYDGKTYTNFTKDGIIEGVETYNFCEDSKGNIWFTAEGYGVYRYDGTNFTQFTTKDGLTTNVVQSILEDHKGQLWFGTWQGISIYDGQKFMNAKDKEPWTK